MTKRLLTELFPHFVKKAQTQHLAKGPFGEGLDAAELDKARVYLKPGEQAPEGANVQTGARGGKYYDDMGGGGAAATPDEAQMYPGEVGMEPDEGGFGGATEDPGGYDIDYGDMGGVSSQQVIDDARAGRTGSDIDYDESGGGGAGAGEGQPFPAEAYDQAMDAEVDAQGGVGPQPQRDPNIEAGGLPNPADYPGYGDNWEVVDANLATATDIDGKTFSNVNDGGPGIYDTPGLHGAADPVAALENGGQWNENRMKPEDRGAKYNINPDSYVEAWRDSPSFGEKMSDPTQWDQEQIKADLTAQGYDLGIGVGQTWPKTEANPTGEAPPLPEYPNARDLAERREKYGESIIAPKERAEGSVWITSNDPDYKKMTGNNWGKPVLNIDFPDMTNPTLAFAMRRDLEQQGFQLTRVRGGSDYGPRANSDSVKELMPSLTQDDWTGKWTNEAEAAGQPPPAVDEDGFPAGASPTGEERRAKREAAVYDEAQMYPSEVGMKPGEGGFGSQTSPPDVSEPTFDGQGNIQTPGSDPYPISELTGSDKETVNALGEQYQQEGGSNPSELLSGYDGPLTEDGIAQYLTDKVQYDDPSTFISDNDYYNARDFASWLEDQAGSSETQKMEKMMHKYNIDNRRRDPIVLSNKGGRQR